MTRVLSCIQPTGDVHLGNYLGALRNWVSGQHECDAFHGIVDLHALTVTEAPGVIGESTVKLAAMLFAVGLDPDVATVFVQSHVPEHAQLAWVMECSVSFGELSRMTQFKDQSSKREGDFISGGLFTYPALQAADILLYDADEVPVGDDQRKSATSESGIVYLLETSAEIAKKFKRAVTDSETDVRYDPVHKPGVSNLLEIMSACTGEAPDQIALRYSQYGPLKNDAGEAVIELLRPIQARYHELMNDRGQLAQLVRKGSDKARAVSSVTLQRTYDAIGFLPR
ncbi:MAG: tryptophan--tRNA ligase [Actinobacteria bacterium]|nr:tryptophan--tRNA ligase [Actinomycetota bacterium]